VDLQAQFQAVIAGLLAYYQPTDTFLMSDGTYTRDELIARFQGFVTACENTKSANQAWRTQAAAEQTLLGEVRPLRSGVRGIVQARFGKKGPQVLQFGFTPAKTPVGTVASKAAAAAKAAATRKARGTVSKKVKATITGASAAAAAAANATAPSPTATPTPASPSPAPTPAAPVAAAPVPTATPATPAIAAPAAAPETPAVAAPPPTAPAAPKS
jgi:hypothetical protein